MRLYRHYTTITSLQTCSAVIRYNKRFENAMTSASAVVTWPGAMVLLLVYIMLLLPHGASTDLRSCKARPFSLLSMAPVFSCGHVAAVEPSCAIGGEREASLVLG
jgi:hypothetical protein